MCNEAQQMMDFHMIFIFGIRDEVLWDGNVFSRVCHFVS